MSFLRGVTEKGRIVHLERRGVESDERRVAERNDEERRFLAMVM
jgi:hypothetical protein